MDVEVFNSKNFMKENIMTDYARMLIYEKKVEEKKVKETSLQLVNSKGETFRLRWQYLHTMTNNESEYIKVKKHNNSNPSTETYYWGEVQGCFTTTDEDDAVIELFFIKAGEAADFLNDKITNVLKVETYVIPAPTLRIFYKAFSCFEKDSIEKINSVSAALILMGKQDEVFEDMLKAAKPFAG